MFSEKKKLRNMVAIRLSPDAKYAAAAISTGDGVVLYKRDAGTGKLTEPDYATDQNFGQETVKYVIEVVFSPDGKFLYVTATNTDSLQRFSRNPQTGKLKFVDMIAVGKRALPGASGLCFNADGKMLYVADENSSAVVQYAIEAAK